MDKTSLFGIVLGFVVLVGGMVLKGSDPAALMNPAALVIIFLGTIAALLNAFPLYEIKKIPTLFKVLFTDTKLITVKELIPIFTDWANIARREGLLA